MSRSHSVYFLKILFKTSHLGLLKIMSTSYVLSLFCCTLFFSSCCSSLGLYIKTLSLKKSTDLKGALWSRYGFNKKRLSLFFKDLIKSSIISLILSTFLYEVLIFLLRVMFPSSVNCVENGAECLYLCLDMLCSLFDYREYAFSNPNYASLL